MEYNQIEKKAIMSARFGNYLELVRTVPYERFLEKQMPIQFDFAKVTEAVAFYMLVNGYSDYFESPYQKLNLVRLANDYRQEASISIEEDDAFLELVWHIYAQMKRLGNASQIESVWDKMLLETIPELRINQERLMEELGY